MACHSNYEISPPRAEETGGYKMQKELLTYRLYAEVEMNREVDTDKDIINAGGFTMKMGGKEVTFDFFLTAASIDDADAKKVAIECKDPMYDYEQTAEITKEMLERVSDISDFFIDTGEADESDLVPKKLHSCYFYLPEEDTCIGIPRTVIKKCSFGCNAVK